MTSLSDTVIAFVLVPLAALAGLALIDVAVGAWRSIK